MLAILSLIDWIKVFRLWWKYHRARVDLRAIAKVYRLALLLFAVIYDFKGEKPSQSSGNSVDVGRRK